MEYALSFFNSCFQFFYRLHYLFRPHPPLSLCTPSSSSSSSSILHYVFLCLSNNKVTSKVSRVILELVLHLMGQKLPDESNEDDHTSQLNVSLPQESHTLGLEILKPFMPMLLQYITTVITRKSNKRASEEGSSQLEFEVLSW